MTLTKKLLAAAIVTAVAIPLTACAGGSGSSASGTVTWWTWDEKQAASYQKCVTGFEKENPGIKVKISQYAVDDYFTKLTAGFVGGNAPDAFQNSVQYLDAYAKQGQLEPLDDYISKSKFDLAKYNVGVDAWKWTDDKQYGLPLDWAASAIYYNKDLVTKAGLTDSDMQNLTWNLKDGGTFLKTAAHLSVDDKGVRGDQPGFDKTHVATYGSGPIATKDFLGQTTWDQFASTTGWKIGNKTTWPTTFNFDDPRFVKVMEFAKSLSDKGFAPQIGAFTTADTEQLAASKVAMTSGGSWEASTFAKLPGVKVGIAPTVLGDDGTRRVMSNSNGNVMWAGSKNKDATFKWMSYMGTEECQAEASTASGSFFPSIPGAMATFADSQKKQGVDLSVFVNASKKGWIYPSMPYANGSEMGTTMEPLLEAYFTGEKNASVFGVMTAKSKQVLSDKD